MTDENQVHEEEVVEKPSMFGIIMNPGIQFERIRKNPKVLVALIVVTLLTTIGMLMMSFGVDYADDPSVVGMDEEGLMIVTIVAQITMVITGLLTPILTILISAAIYLAVAKIAHYDGVKFKQLFSMNTYIFVITMISFLINGLAMMLVGSGSDSEVLFTSINSIVGAEGALGVFLNTIEIFTIWNLIITALGLQIVAKFSKGLSWGVVIIIYILTTGFGMAVGALGSMLGV